MRFLLRRWRGVRLPYAPALGGQSEAEPLNYGATPPNPSQASDPLRHNWLQSDAPQHAGATNWELLAVIGLRGRKNLDGKSANSAKTPRSGRETAQNRRLHTGDAPPGELKFLSIIQFLSIKLSIQ